MEDVTTSLFNIPYQSFTDINTIISFLIILIIFQTLIIFYMSYQSHRFMKDSVDSQKKLFDKFKTSVNDARQLVNNVRKNSLNVFKEANEQSLSIIDSSLEVQEDIKKDLLRKSQEMKDKYSSLLREQSKELSESLRNNAKDTFDKETMSVKKAHDESLQELLSEVKSVVEDVHKHLVDSHDAISMRVETEYKKVDDYLASYKDSKMKDLNKNFDRVVGEIVSSYLKRSLDIPTHEEIIRDVIKNRVTTLQKM